jgi:two-component system phosphate regulon response regulator PhoB
MLCNAASSGRRLGEQVAVKKVLMVDDEASIREMLKLALELSDFECLEAAEIHTAYAMITEEQPDIVLLDWMLPGGSGIELLRRLKKEEATQTLPVIMLTAKAHEDNVIQGLEIGADDYITKPFAPKELIARIRAILRRSFNDDNSSELRVGELVLEVDSRRVSCNGRALEMGPTEFKLLHFFMQHPERAYLRSQLLDHVWGTNVYVEERTVDVHIRRLRKALQAGDSAYSDLVQTVRGTGYRFSPRDLAVS